MRQAKEAGRHNHCNGCACGFGQALKWIAAEHYFFRHGRSNQDKNHEEEGADGAVGYCNLNVQVSPPGNNRD